MFILYLTFHIQFVRSVRDDKLGLNDKDLKRKRDPIRYALSYSIAVFVIGFLLHLIIATTVDVLLLPENYRDNMNQAAALKIKQLNGKCPMITAHRGLASQYPENTLISFKAAIEHQPDYVELDFRSTVDGHLVCIHDANLNRYLGKQRPGWRDKPTESFTLQELQTLDFGSWKSSEYSNTPVATLKQVIAMFHQLDANSRRPTLMLEHKTGTVEQLLEELDAFTDTKQFIVQSFNWPFLQQLKSKRPDIRIAAIGGGDMSESMMSHILKMDCHAVHWNDQITPQIIDQFHQHGIAVWMYTLNHARQWAYANQIGIDAITTDHCDQLRALQDH